MHQKIPSKPAMIRALRYQATQLATSTLPMRQVAVNLKG
ncbi:hypothetical protein ATCC51561_1366 [Campylobacter concisus ATCC 51561]|nr:hypothetical protein ATCC51561_1366 [Campylobacter concisus ATCC 51561]